MTEKTHHTPPGDSPQGDPGTQGEAARLPIPNTERLAALPPELREAWTQYMIKGFKNNEKMFKTTLDAFIKPYNITIALYVTMFVVGILLFLVAVIIGFQGDQPVTALGFAGLSVISFLVFFIRQPLQALEENLEFISWLGVAFNTYWTRLMYISDQDKVQQELKEATEDFSNMVEKLIGKHAELRGKRPGGELPESK
jgi:hypothetical protein